MPDQVQYLGTCTCNRMDTITLIVRAPRDIATQVFSNIASPKFFLCCFCSQLLRCAASGGTALRAPLRCLPGGYKWSLTCLHHRVGLRNGRKLPQAALATAGRTRRRVCLRGDARVVSPPLFTRGHATEQTCPLSSRDFCADGAATPGRHHQRRARAARDGEPDGGTGPGVQQTAARGSTDPGLEVLKLLYEEHDLRSLKLMKPVKLGSYEPRVTICSILQHGYDVCAAKFGRLARLVPSEIMFFVQNLPRHRPSTTPCTPQKSCGARCRWVVRRATITWWFW